MRLMYGSPGSGFAGPRAGCDAPVEMHEADARQHLLPGEAADGLAGRDTAAGRIVGAVVPVAPLAPWIVGVALDHRAGLVGQHRDRAEVVLVEVADAAALGVAEDHAHHGAGDHQVVAPLPRAAGAEEDLGMHPEGVEIVGGSARRGAIAAAVSVLLKALVVDVVMEADRAR